MFCCLCDKLVQDGTGITGTTTNSRWFAHPHCFAAVGSKAQWNANKWAHAQTLPQVLEEIQCPS